MDDAQINRTHLSTVKTALSGIVVVWLVAIWAVCLTGCFTARKRYRLRPRSPLVYSPPTAVEGVSIIRPLKGLDPNIFENLESTFVQNYPKFEIVLSVANRDDPVIPIVNELCAKYPAVSARLVIGEESVGVNPKVNNLVRPFREAMYDLVWVLDSGIHALPDTLARSVDALVNPSRSDIKSGKTIALVHHVPFVAASSNVVSHFLGSRLEEAFLNTTHAKMYIALNTLAIDSCVMGKSNLYRRSHVAQLTGTLKRPNQASGLPTGLEVFGKFLAEDNMIAGAIWHELDLRHTLSCDVAYNAIGDMRLRDYVYRRIRWVRVRKRMVMTATLIEPFTELVLLSIISSWALSSLLGIPPWIYLPIHFSAWLYVDLDVYSSLANHPLPPSRRYDFLTAWILREFLALPIWLCAILGNEVAWRGVKYRMLRNGEVERVQEHIRTPWLKGDTSPTGYKLLSDPHENDVVL